MGLLTIPSGSSETIILDAVLTDLGRKLLARNDGSFQIVRYAFGDDEIDYGLYDKTKATEAEKEANILSTPIFEASSSEDVALKSLLITIRDPTLTTLPILKLSASTGSIKESGSSNLVVTFSQLNENNETIISEILDDVFVIEVDNLLMNVYRDNKLQQITATTPLGISQYTLLRDDDLTATQGGKITVAINIKKLTNSIWDVLGVGVSPRSITTYIRCTGVQSGLSALYTLTITEVPSLRT